MTDKHEKTHDNIVPDTQVNETLQQNALSSNLSDVGTYSYSALCSVSLFHLFEDDWHSDFKKATLQMILKHLKLPDQVCGSVEAIMEGHGLDDPKPFVDAVLEEECLDKSGLLLVTDMVTLAISKGCYDSRMRVLIKYLAWQLRVSWDCLEELESTMAETLEAQQYQMSEEELNEKKKKLKRDKVKRFALIGLATIGGGTLIGLTGGLAAPLVAAGAGAIIGGAGAAALGTTAGVAIIGSLFGVAGAGLAGFKMKKRVGAIEEFTFEPLVWGGGSLRTQTMGKQLHITIAVTGWLTNSMQDFKVPWRSLSESKEQYCLRWESKYLTQLGTAFDYILSGVMSVATQEALKYTVLSGLMAAIAWPTALMSVSSVIDNPWSVCIQRSVAAGKALAEVLLAREQGKRPVTLIGYSLGARVIFSCLEELAKRKGSEGIVEDAILLGTPVSGNPKHWQPLTRVVAGKIINGYCRGDWLLKFLYRTASVHFTTIAGLSPVKWDNRRMHNIDLSDVVSGHIDYMNQLDTIMKVVGVRTKGDVSTKNTTLIKQRKTATECTSSSVSKEKNTVSQTNEGENETKNQILSASTSRAIGDSGVNLPCNEINHSYSSLELTDSDPDDVDINASDSHRNSDSEVYFNLTGCENDGKTPTGCENGGKTKENDSSSSEKLRDTELEEQCNIKRLSKSYDNSDQSQGFVEKSDESHDNLDKSDGISESLNESPVYSNQPQQSLDNDNAESKELCTKTS